MGLFFSLQTTWQQKFLFQIILSLYIDFEVFYEYQDYIDIFSRNSVIVNWNYWKIPRN